MNTFHLRQNSSAFDSGLFAPPSASGASRRSGIWSGPLARAAGASVARVKEYFHRRRVMGELYRLSDHELDDIGISRGEISHIYDPEFAARRAAERLG